MKLIVLKTMQTFNFSQLLPKTFTFPIKTLTKIVATPSLEDPPTSFWDLSFLIKNILSQPFNQFSQSIIF